MSSANHVAKPPEMRSIPVATTPNIGISDPAVDGLQSETSVCSSPIQPRDLYIFFYRAASPFQSKSTSPQIFEENARLET